jgi:hypothetical protein
VPEASIPLILNVFPCQPMPSLVIVMLDASNIGVLMLSLPLKTIFPKGPPKRSRRCMSRREYRYAKSRRCLMVHADGQFPFGNAELQAGIALGFWLVKFKGRNGQMQRLLP